MTGSVSINHHINSAVQFKEMLSEPSPNTKLFLTFGRINPWSNESSPDIANSSYASVYSIWNNMIGAKKLTENDLRFAIPRYNWTSNTTYIAYDHRNPNLFQQNTQFYVVTSDYRIYKCLSNNNSVPSTVEPTAVNPNNTTQTSDGYIWKFMYELSDQDLLRFTTDDYVPIRYVTSDDGSLQWDVQQGAISGSIQTVVVTSNGSSYSSNATATITGDGTGALASVQVNTSTNTVSSVIITNPGQDYTYASLTFTDSTGSGASAVPIISPPGGHGSNPLYELGGAHISLNGKFVRDESGIFPVTNDFRQIALIADPLISDESVVAGNTAYFQGKTITTTGAGDYSQDEYIYQGASLAAATFKGLVVSWNANTGIVTTVNNYGTPSSGSLIGANSAIVRYLTGTVEAGLAKYSGQILYSDNLVPVTRSSDQTESFNIVLHF